VILQLILAGYADAPATEVFGSEHELWKVFEDLKKGFSNSSAVRRRRILRVRWSTGQRNWAKVLWIAFLDGWETETTQRGVYCVLKEGG
jgi:hypothetical protein